MNFPDILDHLSDGVQISNLFWQNYVHEPSLKKAVGS